jgi:FAD/FMN-containing dehydrogenase
VTSTGARPTELTGRIVRRGDPDYPTASAGWNLFFTHQPRVIVFAQQTHDVVNALSWARQHHVMVRVRSGGHSLEGWSNVDDGIVIDVSELKSVSIDTASDTATVGAGLNQLEAVTALGEAGYAVPTGTEGTVGLVGATLGGGFGLLTRRFGMASDNLVAVEIVVPSGADGAKTIIADEQHNTDLLWALRGAGNGNFGIVTSLTYTIHPMTQAIYLTARWNGLVDLPRVFDSWQRSAPHADHRLTSQLEIGCNEIKLVAALASGSQVEASQMSAPMLSVGNPEVSIRDGNWADIYRDFQIATPDEPANWKFTSQFISEPYPAEAIEIVCSFLSNAPVPGCNYFTNAFGGAVQGSEPPGGSAFVHRNALFYAEPGAGWGPRRGDLPSEMIGQANRQTPVVLAWIAEFSNALAPYVNGAYVNVPTAGIEDWETAYWGSNAERLRTIKNEYDPDNVFSFEQGITPASS